MKLTKEEVKLACDELSEALLETISLDEKAEDIKLKQAKARYRLQKARENVRELKT